MNTSHANLNHLLTFAADPMVQLFCQVSYMHANNRAHRDLKPMNVLLTADGKVHTCLLVFFNCHGGRHVLTNSYITTFLTYHPKYLHDLLGI